LGDQAISKISFENVSRTFWSNGQRLEVLRNLSIDVQENEFLVILGPGQCGKTVLLNIAAGLEKATEGKVKIDGSVSHAAEKAGLVFQRTALLPWKTVIENVEFGLKLKGVAKTERRERAKYFINLVGLSGFENSYPNQLSGGMKQRVGIARAYTYDPEVLLMDEPFGALDAQTRYQMEEEILKIWEKEKRTIIFVTNNIEEAVFLGDRIVLLSKCPATIKQIYNSKLPRPRNNLVSEFLQLRKDIAENMDLAL
jgi:NitT/TauT family transport system ATP-binding protein